jgi:hypothetical protein
MSTFNLGEILTWPMSSWFDQIVNATGANVELVRAPDHALPPDLALTAAPAQHLLVSTARAQAALAWAPGEPADRVAQSVRWHLAHPPATRWTDEDTARDEAALAA